MVRESGFDDEHDRLCVDGQPIEGGPKQFLTSDILMILEVIQAWEQTGSTPSGVPLLFESPLWIEMRQHVLKARADILKARDRRYGNKR